LLLFIRFFAAPNLQNWKGGMKTFIDSSNKDMGVDKNTKSKEGSMELYSKNIPRRRNNLKPFSRIINLVTENIPLNSKKRPLMSENIRPFSNYIKSNGALVVLFVAHELAIAAHRKSITSHVKVLASHNHLFDSHGHVFDSHCKVFVAHWQVFIPHEKQTQA
jgi:hypothetical protein